MKRKADGSATIKGHFDKKTEVKAAPDLGVAIAYMQSVGGWSKLEIWQSLYVMSGNPINAMLYLKNRTLPHPPWKPVDSNKLVTDDSDDEGDSQDDGLIYMSAMKCLDLEYGDVYVKARTFFLSN